MASGIASAPKSGKGPRSAEEPTTPLPALPLGPKAPADQIVVSPRAEDDLEDLGDLDDLGVMESATISHLISAAVGDADDDDDDALGLNKPFVPTSGPASGIMRPSATPDDDALTLDMLPGTTGEDASLSFVARSDIMKGADLDDAIATTPMRGFGAPRPPKPAPYAKDGTDIFSPGSPSATARAGDSNLLSFLTGPKGESSNILSNVGEGGGGPTSDLFGDSRILTDLPSDLSRASSDILAGSRVSSDILAGSNASSDILSGNNVDSRGSSLFDDPGRATDRHSDPTGSVVSPDQFVPLFDDLVEGSEIVLNKATVKGFLPTPDPIDDDPGRVSFDIPRKPAKPKADATDLDDDTGEDDEDDGKTSFMAVPEDEEDAMAAEFLGGADRSGVNLLGAFDHQETMEGEEDESGDLFSGPTMMDIDLEGASGVNLLDPGPGSGQSAIKAGRNSDLSIFSGPASSARIPPAEPSGTVTKSGAGPNSPASIFGPDTQGPSSAIFPSAKKGAPGQTDGGNISFDMPHRKKTGDQTDRMQASSLIDWSKNPTDSDLIKQRSQGTDQMSLSGELREAIDAEDQQLTDAMDSDSVFDVQLPSDASTESQLLKAEMYAKAAAAGAAVAESGIIAGRSGKIPKVEPVSSRTKFVSPPPPPRPAATAWLGGTAAGLLAGVGLAAGAYLAGAVPNKGERDLAAIKTTYESQIQQVSSAAAAESEKAKRDADVARQQVTMVSQDLKQAKDAEAELRGRAATAAQTARAANDAKAKADSDLALAKADAETANMKVVAARDDAAKALALRDELANKVAAAEMAVKAKADDLAKATGRADDAEKTRKAAESTLATAAKELQTAGLIDASFDSAKAVAAIPDAVRKAAAAGTSADGAKLRDLADKLVTARRDAEIANATAADTKAKADAALAAAKKDQAETLAKLERDLTSARAGGSADVEKAVAAAGQKYQSQITDLTAALKRDRDDRAAEISRYETRLATQAEEFRSQLTAARAGLMVAATDAERTAAERASRLFGVGTDAYFSARYYDAVTALTEATKANPADARAWYYLGLSHWATGDRNAAVDAFKAGGQWEARSATASRQVGPALERVQGPVRFALDAYRP